MKKIFVLFFICMLSMNLMAQVSAPYHESFENSEDAALWTTYDLNSDDGNWFWADIDTYGGLGYQQSSCFAYIYSYQNAGNDWLVSPGVTLNSGTSYSIGFKYAEFDNTKFERLQVYVGTDPNPANFTELLVTFDSIYSDAWQDFTYSYTPSASGTYYVAFYAYSDVNQGAVLIDEFDISNGSAGISNSELSDNIQLFPNPASGYVCIKNGKDCEITVTDVSGRIIDHFLNEEASCLYNIQNLQSGVYVIRISDQTEAESHRMVVY